MTKNIKKKTFIEKEYDKYVKAICDKISSSETFDSQLSAICKGLFKGFVGVYPKDRIPFTRFRNNNSLIFNLDNHNDPGSHWCAMYKDKGNLYVYDSFGRIVLPSVSSIIYTDPDKEQRNNETNCGQRCIAWLIIVHKYGIQKALQI